MLRVRARLNWPMQADNDGDISGDGNQQADNDIQARSIGPMLIPSLFFDSIVTVHETLRLTFDSRRSIAVNIAV